jgi:hypothetical protein
VADVTETFAVATEIFDRCGHLVSLLTLFTVRQMISSPECGVK